MVRWGLNGLTGDNGLLVDEKEGCNIRTTVPWLNNIKKVGLPEDEVWPWTLHASQRMGAMPREKMQDLGPVRSGFESNCEIAGFESHSKVILDTAPTLFVAQSHHLKWG